MTYLVLGNWKSNGTPAMLESFAASYKPNLEVQGLKSGLALPYHLLHLKAKLGSLWLGAQNVSAFGEGAYTGEISASMLAASGSQFCLVGHSERRQIFGEESIITAEKMEQLLQVGIYPIFCVGETQEQREQGQLQAVLAAQLAPFAEIVKTAKFAVAYEPVWAIGSGVAATPEDVADAHVRVKGILADYGFKVPILYGGSVKPKNAAKLAKQEDVDGFLVGGASLKGADFSGIVAGFCAGKGLARP